MRPIPRIALALSVTGLFVAQAGAQAPPQRRSIVHHYPYPYPGAYASDPSAGFRNPGRVGRFKEYYPAGDQFQSETAAVDPQRQAATFGQGGGAPSYAEQRAAQQIGIQRSSAMQRHIDNYARPTIGYGYGMGYFGGMY